MGRAGGKGRELYLNNNNIREEEKRLNYVRLDYNKLSVIRFTWRNQ